MFFPSRELFTFRNAEAQFLIRRSIHPTVKHIAHFIQLNLSY